MKDATSSSKFRLDWIMNSLKRGQLGMRHPQADGRDVPDERLDARPVEERPCGDAAAQRPWEQPAHAAARAGVDADHPPPALDARELDLVGAHEPGAIDVDELVIEDVLLEQHLLWAAHEAFEVKPCTA